jgi:flagellar hook-associated protein 1 FlgK
MSSDLLTIAASGARAARAALDVASQNIANASTTGYVRRSINLAELAAPNPTGIAGDRSLYGVQVLGVTRNADLFRQAEARRTAGDAARADTQVAGLQDVDNAIESAGISTAITGFEGALAQLSSNPTDTSLRAAALESARTMGQSFNVAATSLAAVGTGQQTAATDAVTQVNTLAKSLAALNLRITSDTDPANDGSVLFDERDQILSKLGKYADVTATVAANGTAAVQMGGASGPALVLGGTATPLAMATAADGTISFSVGATAVAMGGGSLAGNAQVLTATAAAQVRLDALASSLATAVNGAQTGGAALDGSAGQPMFTGTTAATLGVALTSGSQIAVAAAGSPAQSRNVANLAAIQAAMSGANVPGQASSLAFDLSTAVQGATTTRDALDAIAANAQTSLEAQSGVNLDEEAANLMRYQQAFQASGKVMQVASTLFETLFNLH